MPSIDFDQNATTPLDPEVFEAMRPYWLSGGNPESRHALGRAARRALEQARETIARILGATPEEVVFTSGGTEANNLAIFGQIQESRICRMITSPIEHPAVSEVVGKLETEGVAVDCSSVEPDGRVDVASMAGLIRPETMLLTLMLANNETGAIQEVGELARLANLQGIPVHTDAVQAVGRIPVNFRELGVATLAASGHKFHGPAGIGLLLVRKGVKLTPRTFGGGQQKGRRPGTPAVPLAVGLAKALERWEVDSENRIERWTRMTDRLESGLKAALGADRVIRNGPTDPANRLPQTLNVGFPGLDGDALLMQLDLAGVAVSLGSACASGATEPSPTLKAMKVPVDRLRSSVRISLGAMSTENEVEEALGRIVAVVERISHAETEMPVVDAKLVPKN